MTELPTPYGAGQRSNAASASGLDGGDVMVPNSDGSDGYDASDLDVAIAGDVRSLAIGAIDFGAADEAELAANASESSNVSINATGLASGEDVELSSVDGGDGSTSVEITHVVEADGTVSILVDDESVDTLTVSPIEEPPPDEPLEEEPAEEGEGTVDDGLPIALIGFGVIALLAIGVGAAYHLGYVGGATAACSQRRVVGGERGGRRG